MRFISKFIVKSILFKVLENNCLGFLGFNVHILQINSVKFITSRLDLLFFNLIKGCKLFLELRGTGYKFKLISVPSYFGLILRLGYSHLIYIKLPPKFRAHFFNKTMLCLYGNSECVNNVVKIICDQKKINPYKNKGFFWKHSSAKLKKSTKLRF
jgi:ribosomal protein L6P/L9E